MENIYPILVMAGLFIVFRYWIIRGNIIDFSNRIYELPTQYDYVLLGAAATKIKINQDTVVFCLKYALAKCIENGSKCEESKKQSIRNLLLEYVDKVVQPEDNDKELGSPTDRKTKFKQILISSNLFDRTIAILSVIASLISLTLELIPND
jgi:hypothetical protein